MFLLLCFQCWRCSSEDCGPGKTAALYLPFFLQDAYHCKGQPVAPQYSSSPTSNLFYSRDHQMRSPTPLMAALQNPFELYTLHTPLCDLFNTCCYIFTFPRIVFFLQLRESVCIHFTKIKNVIAFFKWSVTILFTRKWRIISLAIPADNPVQKIKFCATWRLRNFSYILNCIFIFWNFQRYDLFSTGIQSCRYWLCPVKGM